MHRLIAFLQSLAALEPSREDHWPALRMAVGIGMPTVLLLLSGRTELVIDAVFGGFAGMYGRSQARSLRFRHQSIAGVLLVSGVALGSSLSAMQAPVVVLVISEALFSALGSVVADWAGFRPRGPFFPLFAFGACAALPSADVFSATAVGFGSAAFAVLIGASSPRAASRPNLGPRWGRPSLPTAVSYAVAVAGSGLLAALAGIGHPHWAMAAAAVPLSAQDVAGRVTRGIHRVLGTFAGLALTAVILAAQPAPAVLAIMVVVLEFPTELFMLRHYALALVFFTPLILLMTQLAQPSAPGVMLGDRGVENLLGVAVGFAVVLAGPHGLRLGAKLRPRPFICDRVAKFTRPPDA